MKKVHSTKKLKRLSMMSANREYRKKLQVFKAEQKKKMRKNVENKNYFFKK